jgi:hypothetical protein
LGKQNRSKEAVSMPPRSASRRPGAASTIRHKNFRMRGKAYFQGIFAFLKNFTGDFIFSAAAPAFFPRRLSAPARHRQTGPQVKALLSGVAVFFIVL